MKKIGMLSALWVAAAGYAVAQGPGTVTNAPFVGHTAAEIQQKVKELTEKARASKDGLGTEIWERTANHYIQIAVRVAPGGGEIHTKTADYFFILSGHANEIVGGTVENSKQTAEGEFRGTAVKGGTPHPLGPGDLINIKANTAHQTVPVGKEPLAYLIVKVDE